MDVFFPGGCLGVSLEMRGNPGTQSVSTAVGGGDNVGVSIPEKHFLMKLLI